tara:strand:- start:102 stop:491 length:390 start_codon:yes stop_codon:yes gene_type:complete
MLNFFAIVLIFVIGLLLIIFKKRNFKKLISKSIFHSKNLKKRKKNIELQSNKNSFSYKHEGQKHLVFYKNSKRNKMFTLFQGNTEDKLKALKIAEELADKSTLPILRKGLRDTSPEVVENAAFLIRKFK